MAMSTTLNRTSIAVEEDLLKPAQPPSGQVIVMKAATRAGVIVFVDPDVSGAEIMAPTAAAKQRLNLLAIAAAAAEVVSLAANCDPNWAVDAVAAQVEPAVVVRPAAIVAVSDIRHPAATTAAVEQLVAAENFSADGWVIETIAAAAAIAADVA